VEDRAFTRIGGREDRRVDCRLITATNKDLRQEVAARRFREDLYYRLLVLEIHLPPLRERKADIPALASFFSRFTRTESSSRTFFGIARPDAQPTIGRGTFVNYEMHSNMQSRLLPARSFSRSTCHETLRAPMESKHRRLPIWKPRWPHGST
jgi:hypothetical protein